MKKLLNKVSSSPRRRVLFWAFLAATIIVMIVIFCFSSQTATKSDELSSSVRETGKEIIGNVIEKVENKTAESFIRFISESIRKIAHIVLYAALGFCAFGAATFYDPIKKVWQKALLVLLVGGLYGASDEIHQLFVAGRTSEVLDVFIDLVGVAIGILIMLAGYKIVMSFIAKKHQKAKKLKV